MSIAFSAPATEDTYLFEEIEDGEVYWVSADRQNPYHCLAEFERLNPDGISRDFNCLNGSWTGTLTELDEGVLELHVHKTDARYPVFLCELVKPSWELSQEIDDEIPY